MPEKKLYVYTCDSCGKQFHWRYALIRHLRNLHQKENELRIFECETCRKQFKRRDSFIRHMQEIHLEPKNLPGNFKCDSCGKQFHWRNALIRHFRNLHQKENELQRIFECDTCRKQFKRRDNFIRHMQKIHQKPKNLPAKFTCDSCGKQFHRRDALIRHLRNLHQKENQYRIFECDTCRKQFKRRDNFIRHMQIIHQKSENSLAKFVCAMCYMTFSQKGTLQRHIRRHMCTNQKVLPAKLGSMKCILCAELFSSVNNILQHIIQYHDIEITHHHLKFSSKDEFDAWKKNMQISTITYFRKILTRQNTKESVIQFICHRSGSYQVLTKRRRRLKCQGIKKMGGFCPASITIRINNINGSCKVSYISTHLGHKLHDKTELAHIDIPKRDRANVASKTTVAIPKQRILIDNVSSTRGAETNLQVYMNGTDYLFDVSYDYKITQTLPPTKDPLYVEAFIIKHEKSILYYKRQNEIDEKYKDLHLTDIVIVMMTPFQEEMLLKYSQKVIAVDGTFGLNRYEFLLHTFLVIDNFHEGVPVVFIISNRNDEVVTTVALESIRDKVGILCPMSFMSDMQLTYINSWEKVMGPAKFHLFCNWHVFETWRKNLVRIKVVDKKKIMRARLYELAMCLDENIFETRLQELLEDPDPDLEVFLSYFKNHYSQNCESWAYCYRKHAFVNTNTDCEAFNRNLKYFHGKLLEKSSLSDCLQLLDQYLQTVERALKKKAIKGKLTSKLKCLRQRHDTFEKELEENTVHVEIYDTEEDGRWDVCISDIRSNVASVYHVQKCGNYCNFETCRLYCEKCDACLYMYQCTCSDNMIKHNMCKHIHALCTTLKKRQEDILTSEEDILTSEEDILTSQEDILTSQEDMLTSQEDILTSQEDILATYLTFTIPVDINRSESDNERIKNEEPVEEKTTENEEPDKNDDINILKEKTYNFFMKILNDAQTSEEVITLWDSIKTVIRKIED